jgi:hypothetical protein
VLHYPGARKGEVFGEILKRKLDAGDANFHGAWFPDPVDFRQHTFTSHARFAGATFNARADFSEATFKDRANFIGAVFGPGAAADFSYVRFEGDADFSTVFHAPVTFNYAHFTREAYFRSASFYAGANFRSATFSTHARFGGGGHFAEQTFLDLQFTRIEKPEHVSFDSLCLHPHWFVNVDSRKFDFTNVTWRGSLEGEVAALSLQKLAQPHGLLATACRRLAVNAEENHRYKEASEFRYMSMDARRLGKSGGFAFWTLDWWYRLASGYGERVWCALAVFVAIWLFFAFLYSLGEPVRCKGGQDGAGCIGWEVKDEPRPSPDASSGPKEAENFFSSFFNSAVYAIETMTLQKPEPRPRTPLARLVVLLCAVLGPTQAALLALAVRRKFMR